MTLDLKDQQQCKDLERVLKHEVDQAIMFIDYHDRGKLIQSFSNPVDIDKYRRTLQSYTPLLEQLQQMQQERFPDFPENYI